MVHGVLRGGWSVRHKSLVLAQRSNTQKVKNGLIMNKEWLKNRKTLAEMVMKHGSKCWYCGREITEKMSLDHIHPKSKRGSDMPNNLAIACFRCNTAKYNDDVTVFLGWLAHIRSGNFECRILGKLPKVDIEKISPQCWDILRKDFWDK